MPSDLVLIDQLSGIVINQSFPPSSGVNNYSSPSKIYQEFLLPNNYARGTTTSEKRYPELSKLQLLVSTNDSDQSIVNWTIEYKHLGVDWIILDEGSTLTSVDEGDQIWLDIPFTHLVNVTEDVSKQRFRFSIIIPNESQVSKLWFSTPNPLSLSGNSKAYASDGTTPLTHSSLEYSFCFRLFGLIADQGIDFLGNSYRSAVVRAEGQNVSTGGNSQPDTYWMSRPNPSRFAVESLYFDMQSQAVVDRILIDPITTGIYCTVYYSNDGDTPSSEEDWENKLWIPVTPNMRLLSRETFTLPSPLSARFFMLEFTYLQAQTYTPEITGSPIIYKKHPKWVIDHFLGSIQAPDLISGSVAVINDSLTLAYDYYLDDLRTTTDNLITQSSSQIGDALYKVDPTTLSNINLNMNPYEDDPSLLARSNSVLGQQIRITIDPYKDLPSEGTSKAIPSSDVSVADRDAVLMQSLYPPMFFYLTCRHQYREVMAKFGDSKAYFAGIRQVAFLRQDYTTSSDTPSYLDIGEDFFNVERNEFNE